MSKRPIRRVDANLRSTAPHSARSLGFCTQRPGADGKKLASASTDGTTTYSLAPPGPCSTRSVTASVSLRCRKTTAPVISNLTVARPSADHAFPTPRLQRRVAIEKPHFGSSRPPRSRGILPVGKVLPPSTVGGVHRVPREFRICRHFHPRVQDELSQSFDFLIFKRGNQIQTGLFKGELVSLTR